MLLSYFQNILHYKFQKEAIVLLLLSVAIGFVSYGYIVISAVLGYLFLRENEEKYICILGYVLATLIKGNVSSYEALLVVLTYFLLLLALHLLLHNPSVYVYVSGLAILYIYMLFVKNYPIKYTIIYAIIFLLIAYELRSLLFERQQAFLFLISCICNCLIIQLTFLNNDTLKLLIMGVLLVEAMYLDLRQYLVVFLATSILQSLSFELSASLIILLISIIISKESKSIALIMYWLMAYGTNASLFEISVITACFLMVYNISFETYINNIKEEDNQSSIVLLNRLADICGEFIDDERMKSFETVLRTSSEELQKMNEEHMKENQIKDILQSYYYDVISVDMTYNGALYINLKMNDISKGEVKEEILPLLGSYLKTPVYLMEYARANMLHSYHECVLVVYPYIKVKYDYLQSSKGNVCGDSIMALKQNEQQMFILSDGMGHGEKAKEQSSLVAKILLDLSQVRMPFMSVLKLMNEILLVRGLECYATLDLLCIDTVMRQAYLYKAGSFDTYLIRNDKVYSFKSDSIPLGIISKIDVNLYSFKVQCDDLLVLVSDGFEHPSLKKWILDSANSSTGVMVKNIFNERSMVGVDDDMSILVIKVENCFNFL